MTDIFLSDDLLWRAEIKAADLLTEHRGAADLIRELVNEIERLRRVSLDERKRCAAIAQSADRPGRNTGTLIAEEIMK